MLYSISDKNVEEIKIRYFPLHDTANAFIRDITSLNLTTDVSVGIYGWVVDVAFCSLFH